MDVQKLNSLAQVASKLIGYKLDAKQISVLVALFVIMDIKSDKDFYSFGKRLEALVNYYGIPELFNGSDQEIDAL